MNKKNILTPEEIYAAERVWQDSKTVRDSFSDLNEYLNFVAGKVKTTEGVENDMSPMQ